VHGAFLFKLLSKYYYVIWVGQTFPLKLTIFNAFYILFLEFWKLLVNFKKMRFSLVIVQFVSLDGIVAVLFKRIFKTKLVLFAMGSDVLKIREHAFAYPIIKFIIAESDFVFCTSSLIEEKLKTMGFDASKIKVVPSVVDFDDFEPYYGPKMYDVVNVGALDSNKNQMLLIKACELFPSVKALIIGDGPLRLALESENAKKKLGVVFLGKIPRKQVLRELQKSRIYVHTSKSEGIPKAVLEAMFAGLPVVLVESPYVYVLKHCYGFIFHTAIGNSAEDLANKILEVSQKYEGELNHSIVNKRIVSTLVSETLGDITRVLDGVMQNNYQKS
jgi:glycosyltransferase involved in cell wall biosynthesis